MSNVVVQPTWKVLEISWNVKKCNRLQSVLEVASSRCYNVASRASWFWNLQWNGLPADTDWKHINLGSNANHQDKFIWIHVPQILFEFLVLKNKHLNIFASSGYFVLEIQETDGHSHMGSAQAFLPWSTKYQKPFGKPATECHLPVVELRLHRMVDMAARWWSQSRTPNSGNLLAEGFLRNWTGTTLQCLFPPSIATIKKSLVLSKHIYVS